MTLPTHEEILSAFVDGEPVEPRALLAALESPGACSVLAGHVRLRTALGQDVEAPSPAWTERVEREVERVRAAPWRRSVRVPVPLATATVAASVVLAIALAVVLGTPSVTGVPGPREPIPEARAADAGRPPAAARVLTFEPGSDWHQQEAAR